MRLLAVELNRFLSRRAILLLVLAAMVLAVALVGKTAWDTRPLSARDRAEATAQAELEGQRTALREEVAACEQDPTTYLGPEAGASDCADTLVPSAEAYYPRQALDLRHEMRGNGLHLALVVVGLLVIAGCTFAGTDWASGSMSNQLLFEPRRLKVWFAKAAAVTLGSGLVAAVVLGGFWLALTAVSGSRGLEIPATDASRVGWHLLRAVVLAMAATLGGYALTMVFRHTVATLALLFVYSVGGEIAGALLPVEGSGRWSVGNNVFGWLLAHHRYFDPSLGCAPGDRCSSTQLMTHLEAATFLGALLVVAVLVSVVVFRRRDV